MNILFFSNNCESSKALISMMQAENLIRFFHMHCTDGNATNPPQIKVTPDHYYQRSTNPICCIRCICVVCKDQAVED